MAIELTEADLIKSWDAFLNSSKYLAEIIQVADFYDNNNKSICVNYWDIDKFDSDLADYLLERPISAIGTAETVIANLLPADLQKHNINFRVTGLSDVAVVNICDIGEEHVGRLIAINGIIQRCTEKKPQIQTACFECVRCGNLVRIEQDDLFLETPLDCSKNSGGCGRSAASTSFELKNDSSVFTNMQKLRIQEPPENLRGGTPEFIVAYIRDDLVGMVEAGYRGKINGVVKCRPKTRGSSKLTVFDKWIDVISIEILDRPYEEIEITPEDEVKIRKESQNPKLYDNLRKSVSPSIYGYSVVKDAIVLQSFGGVPKIMQDKREVRGDIHILLIGDPASAKTQLLRGVSKIAPRCVFASGKHATGGGLTAIAVRDDFGDGRWGLEAGAMVIADRGHICIDEFEKMNKHDRSKIHDAMDPQVINVTKAGIIATLYSRCSVLAAANPVKGRFDEYNSIPDQIDLPPTLLSRFDAIFIIKDIPDKEKDSAIAEHILKAHRCFDDLDIDVLQPHYDPEFLRKYIAYAKGITPRLSDEATNILHCYYADLRGQYEEGAIPVTPRQLEGLIRLSEASARARLREEVMAEDAERAKKVFECSMRQVAGKDGGFDIDAIETGITTSQRTRIIKITEIIDELCRENKNGANINDILECAGEEGLDEEKVRKDIEHMLKNGDIYDPKSNEKYRLLRV